MKQVQLALERAIQELKDKGWDMGGTRSEELDAMDIIHKHIKPLLDVKRLAKERLKEIGEEAANLHKVINDIP